MTESELRTRLAGMINGYCVTQAVYAAATLGIADLLENGPRTIDDLATATGTRPDRLYRLLRALASVDLFAETEQGTFTLTPMADLLRSAAPFSARSFARMAGEEHYATWGRLLEALKSEENAFEVLYGKPVFEFLGDNPEKGRIFDDAMTGIHGQETAAILEVYDFRDTQTLIDVGGGNGSKLTAILQKHAHLQGMLYDLPHVIERARTNIEAAGLSDRCQLIGGDFFQSVPSGADTCLMRHIIHDWDDEKSITILKNCHAALPEGGRLLVVETVIPPGNDPCGAKFLDLTMMLIPGGKERTEDEYRTLYEAAGFELTRVIPTAGELSLVEGIRR